MSRTVNMHEAKTTLSKLVVEVENGADIVLARKGKPVAKLVAIDSSGASDREATRAPLFSPELLENWDAIDAKVATLFHPHLPDRP